MLKSAEHENSVILNKSKHFAKVFIISKVFFSSNLSLKRNHVKYFALSIPYFFGYKIGVYMYLSKIAANIENSVA